MNVYFIMWCFLFLVAVLFELLSPGFFFFLSFACGCIAAAIANFFSLSMSIQLTVFAIGSFLSLILLRKYVSRSLKGTLHPTNVDALIGKKGTVTEVIYPNQPGYVKINGELWLSKTVHHESIKNGEIVEVVGVKGSHVIVKKISDQN